MSGPGPARHQRGRVVEFDAQVGLGVVAAAGEEGAPVYPFHCTQIADGTRTIEVGTGVIFAVVAGRRGRWEAAEVAPAV